MIFDPDLDFSILINWTSPFPKLGVSGIRFILFLFFFILFFIEIPICKQRRPGLHCFPMSLLFYGTVDFALAHLPGQVKKVKPCFPNAYFSVD